jgi:hypothetical protein
MLTFGVPTSPGVPSGLADLTLTLGYNDFEGASALFEQDGSEIACLIIEPIAGNMNCILPKPGYLQHLRDLCSRHGALLIFDEVMTGFRVALGGAQALYGVTPDLSTFGKIIGGGMPVGAYGGRREIMSQVAPSGPIYQAGTLSGNPVAMAAGLATLELIQTPGFYEDLMRKTNLLCDGLEDAAREAGVKVTTNRVPGMFGLFFTDQKVESFAQATACDIAAFNRFFHGLLKRGVYFAPRAANALTSTRPSALRSLRAWRDAAIPRHLQETPRLSARRERRAARQQRRLLEAVDALVPKRAHSRKPRPRPAEESTPSRQTRPDSPLPAAVQCAVLPWAWLAEHRAQRAIQPLQAFSQLILADVERRHEAQHAHARRQNQ